MVRVRNTGLASRLAWLLLITTVVFPIFAEVSSDPAFAVATPFITQQPLPANPALGGTGTLSVSATVPDGGTLSYKWYRRATILDTATALSDSANISGSSSNVLTISNAASTNAGLYTVVITNTIGALTSSVTSSEVSVYVGLQGDPFSGTTLAQPSNWVITGSDYLPCLTAINGNAARGGGSADPNNMGGCLTGWNLANDTFGEGAFRLVPASKTQSTYALYNAARTASNGLDISFYSSMWGGRDTAGGKVGDGFAFFLKDGNDTNSTPGKTGGALGYSTGWGSNGISNALFGVGFDAYGNFVATNNEGSDCNNNGLSQDSQFTYTSAITRNGVTKLETETGYTSSGDENYQSVIAYGNGMQANQIVIRGPQGTDGTHGYCIISPTPSSPGHANLGSLGYRSRLSGTHLMRVTIEPNTYASPMIRVYVDGVQVTSAPAPMAYRDSQTFKFGFSGGTGDADQNVDIWSLTINTFNGLTPPDPPSNIFVNRVIGSNGGSQTISWTAPVSWGSSETGTGFHSYTAKVFDANGVVYQNLYCASYQTSCTINNIPSGNYVVKVFATNKANISSIYSTVLPYVDDLTPHSDFTSFYLTNYTQGSCISQANAATNIDTLTITNYCGLRINQGTNVTWYVPQNVNSISYLMLAGGGGGGKGRAGGGGGGGFETGTITPAGTTSYNLTIGSGGAGATGSTPARSGGNTLLGGRTVYGGGGGGSPDIGETGTAGGSGGGGAFNFTNVGVPHNPPGGAAQRADTAAATITPSGYAQGYAGGRSSYTATSTLDAERYTGGGGGAGGPGVNGSGGNNTESAGQNPNGGPGAVSNITGSAVTYGGGGGGSSGIGPGEYNGGFKSTKGGAGGNGASFGGYGNYINSSQGISNDGTLNATDGYGGGGGGAADGTGGNGGRGVVILRWIPSPASLTVANVSLYSGRTASFAVSGLSSLTHSYQWQALDATGNWYNIAGATSSTYTLTQVSTSQSGSLYRCKVTDSDGTLSSFGYSTPGALVVYNMITTSTDYALNFNGTSEYATTPNDASIAFNDTFTAEIWAKPANVTCASDCVFFIKENSVALAIRPTTLGIFNPDGGTTLTVQYAMDGNGSNPSSATWNWIDTKIPVEIGNWQHLALVKTGTTNTANSVNVYVNGQLRFNGNPYACSSGCTSSVSATTKNFTIGARTQSGASIGSYFAGQLDHFVLWNYARTQTQVAGDMNTYDVSSTGIQAVYDANEGSGSAVHNMAAVALTTTDLNLPDNNMFVTVESTTTTNGVTQTLIPRTILNNVGGWTAPSIKSKVLVLATGGGGGGGADGGSGGSGAESRFDTTTIAGGTIVSAIIGQGGRPTMWSGGYSGTYGASTLVGWSGATKYVAVGGNPGAGWSTSDNHPVGGGTSSGASGQGSGGTQLIGGAGGVNDTGQSPNDTPFVGGDGPYSYITGASVRVAGGGGGGLSVGGTSTSAATRTGAVGGSNGGGSGGSHVINKGSTFGQYGFGNYGGGGGAGSANGYTANGVDGTNQRTSGGTGGPGAIRLRYLTITPTYGAPQSDTTTAGLTDTFTITGAPLTGMGRSYQWIYSKDFGATWQNVDTGTGRTSASYVTPVLTTAFNNYQFAAVITDTDSVGLTTVDTSAAAILLVNPAITFTSDTTTTTIKWGAGQTILHNSWQYGTGTLKLTVNPTSTANGKITVDTSTGNVVIDTWTVPGTYYETLTVTDSKTAFTNQPIKVILAKADTLTVTPNSPTLTYGDTTTAGFIETSTLSGLTPIDSITVVHRYSSATYPSSTTFPVNAGIYTINDTITAADSQTVTNGQLSSYQAVLYNTGTLTINRGNRNSFAVVSSSGSLFAVLGTPLKLATINAMDTGTVTYNLSGGANCVLDTTTGVISLNSSSPGTCQVFANIPQTLNWNAKSSSQVTITFYQYVNNSPAPAATSGSAIALAGSTTITIVNLPAGITITSVNVPALDTSTNVLTFYIAGTGLDSPGLTFKLARRTLTPTAITPTGVTATLDVTGIPTGTVMGAVNIVQSGAPPIIFTGSNGYNITNGQYTLS